MGAVPAGSGSPHGPQGRWESSTCIAARRVTGLTATGVLDGPMDGVSFLAYVEQILVPTLQPGDIVIADNLPAHKVDGVQAAIEAAGAALWFFPPDSPYFDPSSYALPSSKPCSAPPGAGPSTRYGRCSARASHASRRPSVKTISATAVTRAAQHHEKRG